MVLYIFCYFFFSAILTFMVLLTTFFDQKRPKIGYQKNTMVALLFALVQCLMCRQSNFSIGNFDSRVSCC